MILPFRVKFGVPVSEAFSNDIPATLLVSPSGFLQLLASFHSNYIPSQVLLLKVNKQGPMKKDIWRAPGNQAHVRKLIRVMQHGRLVNIENFSPYTAASVIKVCVFFISSYFKSSTYSAFRNSLRKYQAEFLVRTTKKGFSKF